MRKAEQELERLRKDNAELSASEEALKGELEGQTNRIAQLENELKEQRAKVKELEGEF